MYYWEQFFMVRETEIKIPIKVSRARCFKLSVLTPEASVSKKDQLSLRLVTKGPIFKAIQCST